MTPQEARQYSPLTLAFLGDSVYEQLVRERLVLMANRPAGELHRLAVEKVRAEYQSAGVLKLIDEGRLSDEELDIFRRGRNSKVNPPKHSTFMEYRNATGLECLFGYLYLTAQTERIRELFELCCGDLIY
ncbi:MAG: ribonuclease III [Ruminococcus sp.]|nr:ribonuclease III [Ruminococcus sp.]